MPAPAKRVESIDRKARPLEQKNEPRIKSIERTTRTTERASRELGKAFRQFAPAADDRAVDLLAARVRGIDSAATDDEISHFLAVKAHQAIASRRVQNLVGFLVWAVPQCFGGSMVQEYRDARRQEEQQTAAPDQAPPGGPEPEPSIACTRCGDSLWIHSPEHGGRRIPCTCARGREVRGRLLA
jgi:hypothetical protein